MLDDDDDDDDYDKGRKKDFTHRRRETFKH